MLLPSLEYELYSNNFYKDIENIKHLYGDKTDTKCECFSVELSPHLRWYLFGIELPDNISGIGDSYILNNGHLIIDETGSAYSRASPS